MKQNKKGQEGLYISVFIAIFAIAVIVLVTGFDYVGAGNIGVKDTMGVVDPTPWGPGVQWTGVFTSTHSFSIRVQLVEYEASASSKDLQMVNTKIALNFKLRPDASPEIYKTIGENYQSVIIAPVIQEAVKSSTAMYTAEDLIKERTRVKNDITNYIISKLDDKGLVVTEVAITDFSFSDEFDKAIEAKQVAEQNALTAKNKLEEMRYTSEAMKLQSEVLEIKKLDIQQSFIDKWDGSMPKVLITSGNGQNMLLGIDAESLMQSTE